MKHFLFRNFRPFWGISEHFLTITLISEIAQQVDAQCNALNFSALKPHKIQRERIDMATHSSHQNLHGVERKTVVGILTRWPDLKWTVSYLAMSTINPESLSPGCKNGCCSLALWFIAETIIENLDLKMIVLSSWCGFSRVKISGNCERNVFKLCVFDTVEFDIESKHCICNPIKALFLKRPLECVNICLILKSIFEINWNEFHQCTIHSRTISMTTSILATGTLLGAELSTGNYRHYRRADPCQVDFRTSCGSEIWVLLTAKGQYSSRE